MDITLSGNPLHTTKKEVVQCLNFCAQELMHYNLIPNLSIDVKIYKFPPELKGYCGFCDYEFPEWGNPREFSLEIERGISRRNTLRTIAHEMKHVEQYATGKLKDYVKYPGTIRWMGKKIKINEYRYMYVDKDEKYQFEMEAIRAEEKLYRAYLEYQRKTK